MENSVEQLVDCDTLNNIVTRYETCWDTIELPAGNVETGEEHQFDWASILINDEYVDDVLGKSHTDHEASSILGSLIDSNLTYGPVPPGRDEGQLTDWPENEDLPPFVIEEISVPWNSEFPDVKLDAVTDNLSGRRSENTGPSARHEDDDCVIVDVSDDSDRTSDNDCVVVWEKTCVALANKRKRTNSDCSSCAGKNTGRIFAKEAIEEDLKFLLANKRQRRDSDCESPTNSDSSLTSDWESMASCDDSESTCWSWASDESSGNDDSSDSSASLDSDERRTVSVSSSSAASVEEISLLDRRDHQDVPHETDEVELQSFRYKCSTPVDQLSVGVADPEGCNWPLSPIFPNLVDPSPELSVDLTDGQDDICRTTDLFPLPSYL